MQAKTSTAKSKAEQLDALERRYRGGLIIEQVGQTTRFFFGVLAACFVAWCIHLIVADLAGKVTDANIALKILANLEFSMAVSWIVGLGGAGYGISQNRLKQKTIRKMHGRITDLEKIIDPNRSSSTLGPSGETNPEDK